MEHQLYSIFKQFPSIQTDTRKLKSGDLFFALKGDNFNGNKFAQQALDLGAAYSIIDEPAYCINEKTILVSDVLTALQDLATMHRDTFSIPFIGITGSNGKTTTKELILTVLSKKYKTHATKGNLNNHIGVPLTLLEIKSDCEIAIIEMGANHQKEIEAYCQWAKPTHAIINNCGKAHLEGFGSLEGVRKGKGELYDYIRANDGEIFINADLDYLKPMAEGIERQYSYGEYDGYIKGKCVASDPTISVAILSSKVECIIKTHLVGDYNVPNVLAAVSIGLHFDVSIEEIKQAIEAYVPDNNRSQQVEMNGLTVILDAYNANPTSMLAAIHSFSNKVADRKILMLGAMKELGNESESEHQSIVEEIKKNNWAQVVLIGQEFKEAAHQAHFTYFEKSSDAKDWFRHNTQKGDYIYIKGSRLAAMEKIIEA